MLVAVAVGVRVGGKQCASELTPRLMLVPHPKLISSMLRSRAVCRPSGLESGSVPLVKSGYISI